MKIVLGKVEKDLTEIHVVRDVGSASSRLGSLSKRLESLGKNPGRTLKSLRVLDIVGIELQNGASSIRAVERAFEARDRRGLFPQDLPSTDSSIYRWCQEAAKFMGYEHFGLGRPIQLFSRKGRGWSFEFTETGWITWQLAHDFLQSRFPEFLAE
jgi:hypothetical protein